MTVPVPVHELRTERLVLRQWRDADRDAGAALNADPRVMEHFPSTQGREESDRWFDFNRDRLAKRGWGQGYAPEGARAALDLAWDELGLDEVVSFTAVGNAKSRRVMEKLGLSLEGEFDHPRMPEGHPIRRHVLYRIDRPADR